MSKSGKGGGYGNPPKEHQFQKGKSGNPKGRPKGAKSIKTIVEDRLSQKIMVTIGGKKKSLTKKEAIIEHMIANALKGDSKARSEILKITALIEASETKGDGGNLPPSEADYAVLRAAFKNVKWEDDDE